jgi:methylphosphotriester-DNA--protein-cysteine methyltransferase
MIKHTDFEDNKRGNQLLHLLIKEGKIVLGGNMALKIYGSLQCKSGKRMSRANRIFFSSEKEAIDSGYRPCAHCMRKKYLVWKAPDKEGKRKYFK